MEQNDPLTPKDQEPHDTEETINDLDEDTPPDNTPEDDFETKYQEAMQANATQKEMYLRKVAEFENFRKRLEKEKEQFTKFANEKILNELLPVLDSLEMTLTHVPEDKKQDNLVQGVELTLKQLLHALENCGVKEISGEGEDFDPNLQEAIGTEPSEELGSGKVTKVHRKGYTLNGKVIRAAMVTVSE